MRVKASLASRLLCVVFLLLFSRTAAANGVIYVDADAPGANDGSSWKNAYVFLQDALTYAETAEKPIEICVAQGVYKPNQRTLQTPNNGDNTYTLINEVTLKGGYAGFGETDPNARNWDLHKSVLSGDLNGDDVEVEDPCDILLIESNRSDNSPVVVRANYMDATAVLDGFVITGGYFMKLATGPPNGGAGMHIYQGSPTIRNCTFAGNAAREIGGGLLNRGGSNPTLVNCAFIGNYAESGGGIYNTPNIPAPGMISEGSNPTLVNCTFDNNYALKNGGGMYNYLSDPMLTDCTFRRNRVTGPYSGSTRGPHTGGGGGIYNSNSNPEFTNCLFSENSAGNGGGMYNETGNPTLINCVFRGNSSEHCGGGMYNYTSNLTLTNCTFSGNFAGINGGGIANIYSKTMLTNCTFSKNYSVNEAGGMDNDYSNLTLINCTFSANSALSGGGMSNETYKEICILTLISCTFSGNSAMWAGGMSNRGVSPKLTNCNFSSNSAIDGGGGMHNSSSSPAMTNCIFSANSAKWGGAIESRYSSPNITNCIFSSNTATYGGATHNVESNLTITNCTFTQNSAQYGNILSCDSSPRQGTSPSNFEFKNCILYNGGNEILNNDASTFDITYSKVQDGWPGEGNIDVDPCFIHPGYWVDANDPNIAAEANYSNAFWVDGDYHLKSQAGRWDSVTESWIFDDVTSPCIDAGDPNSPVAFEPFPNGSRINIGAYGGTPEASMSFLTDGNNKGTSFNNNGGN